MTATLDRPLAIRTRRRVAVRLLPFVFVLYVIAYVDRINVSFANLRMSADLGFSDRVYGLGVAAFYLSYILLEIPGAVIAERWSPRKWIARIMITWGAVTMMTGFIHSSGQFYGVRFLLGAAEASFLPAMLVYLTRWFSLRDRSRAIACLFAALPFASLIGSPLAGVLLGVQWAGLAGWRWLFIVEGFPAVVLGVITLGYLTDRPAQARWLGEDEREWLADELNAERKAKGHALQQTVRKAFTDGRVVALAAVYVLVITGALANIYWIPTFVKRLSGTSITGVTSLLMLPALLGLAGTLANGWHSDKTGERRWHAAAPLLAAAAMYGCVLLFRADVPVAVACLLLGSGFLYAFYPVFWALPTLILSDTAAAASFGLIVSLSQIGGIIGPYAIGYLNETTHSRSPGLGFIAALYLAAAGLVIGIRIQQPARAVAAIADTD
ncbi:MAG TPA: MFS transporter [Steroidobacteraceae bacterium]|nr:MFS transporter [Steroidobacteraceae bacterium]